MPELASDASTAESFVRSAGRFLRSSVGPLVAPLCLAALALLLSGCESSDGSDGQAVSPTGGEEEAEPGPRTKQADAQFLMQATFGPTRGSLSALAETDYVAWIRDQMSRPPELHREYYRARANPRSHKDASMAAPRSACAKGSRWQAAAFGAADEGKAVSVANGKVFVAGKLRTDIDPAFAGNIIPAPTVCTNVATAYMARFGTTCEPRTMTSRCTKLSHWVDNKYCQQSCFDAGMGYDGDDCSAGWPALQFEGYLCKADELVGGRVALAPDMECKSGFIVMKNLAVWLADGAPETGLAFEELLPGVLILSERSPPSCQVLSGGFVRVAGKTYRHDDRLELLENTPGSPGSNLGAEVCPNVPKTFLNEKECTLRPACAHLSFGSTVLELDAATREQFYTVGRHFVYAVTGLRPSAPPCGSISRWKWLSCAVPGACAQTTGLSAADAAAIAGALAQEGGWLRDVAVECGQGVPAEAVVELGGQYFQHVHLHEHNVYDFSDWVQHHPGLGPAITKWATGDFVIRFPDHHPMERWESSFTHSHLHYVGKQGFPVDFGSLPIGLQTALLNALGVAGSTAFSHACGSPGEVANRPDLGHHFSLFTYYPQQRKDAVTDLAIDSPNPRLLPDLSRGSVWATKALRGEDQLRQRVAWAMAQIFVVGSGGGVGDATELFLNYYDIFVRHAFGSFRAVLREVTYSPLMGEYLSYVGNSAFDYNHFHPDENYAREVMQLFTIGLFKLNPDGTRQKDDQGRDVPTYTNEHITSFARVFTGFLNQYPRPNVEAFSSGRNVVDPMRMVEKRHDIYPKPDLHGGFLGDGYPLCSDLPPMAFLAKGARYEFLGQALDESQVLVLHEASPLFARLCPGSAAATCAFALDLELDAALACYGNECDVDTVRFVQVGGGYYEFVPPTCVHLFFPSGRITAEGGSTYESRQRRKCSDPLATVAGTSCCNGGGCTDNRAGTMIENNVTCEDVDWSSLGQGCNKSPAWRDKKFCQYSCWSAGVGYDGDDCSSGRYQEARVCTFPGEHVSFVSAQARCERLGLSVCSQRTSASDCGFDATRVWTPEACTVDVEVHELGHVSSQSDATAKQNKFYVPWRDGFPKAGSCPSACAAGSAGCVCPTAVDARAVFDRIPTKAEALGSLRIGAHPPAAACFACDGDVRAYSPGGGSGFDASTVFEVDGQFLKNMESWVVLAPGDEGGGHAFRNPPVFMLEEQRTGRKALAEVESLLDHLFHHSNTPVFIARHLIQRLVSSNPSPAYVRDVAEAFAAGEHDGEVFSGGYGDLAATVAAVLLHPEARGQEASQETHGALREPVVKLMHFMRAMEYTDHAGDEPVFDRLIEVIGQWPYESPTVFNFFTSDFRPARFPDGLVGPEFEILTAPHTVSFLNGMMSLIDHGLSACDEGFGRALVPCSRGRLAFNPDADGDAGRLEELDLLLTGGRLGGGSVAGAVRAAYAEAPEGEGLQAAQRAILLTPEFNTLASPAPSEERVASAEEAQEAHDPASYRALVMLFLNGGADTFNMLVPMSCGLYDEYMKVRTGVALEPFQLHEISAAGQQCEKFGVHYQLPLLKELYDQGSAAFVSNVGSLVEPTTKQQYFSGGARRCTGLFSHSDQAQAAQTLKCQVQGGSPRGVGGRIADALAGHGLRTTSFSTAGAKTWSQGFGTSIEVIDPTRGVVQFSHRVAMEAIIGNITGQRHRNVYREEYARSLEDALDSSSELGTLLGNVSLETDYQAETDLARQLRQVARLIATRQERRAERDLFFVGLGGFDTHKDLHDTLNGLFGTLDSALRGFVAELRAQGVFEKTVLVTSSDFGRTLASNGAGTDHGWAGNHIVLGGKVRGGRVVNDFPASLLEGGEQDIGRGRLIPKYPWESMMVPIASWMGVEPSQLADIFPNLENFNLTTHIVAEDSLFRA